MILRLWVALPRIPAGVATLLLLLSAGGCHPPLLRDGPFIIEGKQAASLEELDVDWLGRQTDSLNRQNPARDACEALRAGELRFWALSGGMEDQPPWVPGLSASDQALAIAKLGVRTFRYTGEGSVSVPGGDSTLFRWQDATTAYAARYNRERLRLRPLEGRSRRPASCGRSEQSAWIVAGGMAGDTVWLDSSVVRPVSDRALRIRFMETAPGHGRRIISERIRCTPAAEWPTDLLVQELDSMGHGFPPDHLTEMLDAEPHWVTPPPGSLRLKVLLLACRLAADPNKE